jgi:hypothetical protein
MVYRGSNPCACLAKAESHVQSSNLYCDAIRGNMLSSARQLARFKTSFIEI